MTVSVRKRKRADRVADLIVELLKEVEVENRYRGEARFLSLVPRTNHSQEVVEYCDEIRSLCSSRAWLAATRLRMLVRRWPMTLKGAWRLVNIREVMES